MDNGLLYDCLIIGGGISGVSFAHYLKKEGQKIAILEKDSEVGGRMLTKHSTHISNYWSDLGSHTCYNSYINLLNLIKEIDSEDQIQPLGKGSFMLYDEGKIKSISSKLNILKFLVNAPKFMFAKKEGKTVKEYFSPIVGRWNYNHLFTYAFRAVICQFPDNYPVELFLKKRTERNKEIPRKFTFKKGMSQLPQTIVKEDKIETLLNTVATKIEKSNNGFIVYTNKGEFQTKTIAFACNPLQVSSLLHELNTALQKYLPQEVSNLYSTNVIVPSSKLNLKLIAGIINTSDLFMSSVTGDLLGVKEVRSFTFHFENEITDKERLDIICKVLKINKEDILEEKTVSHSLPALKYENIDAIGELKKQLEHQKDIYILGNYFYGLSIEDCVHRSKDEANRYKNNFLP